MLYLLSPPAASVIFIFFLYFVLETKMGAFNAGSALIQIKNKIKIMKYFLKRLMALVFFPSALLLCQF